MSNVIEEHKKFTESKDIRELQIVRMNAERIWSIIAQAFPSQNIRN